MGMARGHTSLRDILDFSALKAPRFLAMHPIPVAGAMGFVTFLTYVPSALGALLDRATAPSR